MLMWPCSAPKERGSTLENVGADIPQDIVFINHSDIEGNYLRIEDD